MRWFALLTVLIVPGRMDAASFMMIDDPREERQEFLNAAQRHPQAKAVEEQIGWLAHRLFRHEHGLPASGWVGVDKLPDGFSIPAVMPRIATITGGLDPPGSPPRPRRAWQEHHFYLVGDAGAIQFISGRGRIAAVVFYLPVDDDFPRGLDARMEWDRTRFMKFRRLVLTDLGEYTPWQLDKTKPIARTLMPGSQYSFGDVQARFKDWSLVNPTRISQLPDPYDPAGFMCAQVWCDAQGRPVREARIFYWSHYSGNGPLWPANEPAEELIEYDPPHPIARAYYCRRGKLEDVHWFDKDANRQVRQEYGKFDYDGRWRSYQWVWFAPDGKRLRTELDGDDNGIPELVSFDADGADPKPLVIDDSWAVHPDLIPASLTIPDQELWRVHVVLAVEPAFEATHWKRSAIRIGACVGGPAVVILLIWRLRKSTFGPR